MDFTLTEDQKRLQAVARDFAYKELRPRARELDAERNPMDCYSPDLVRRADELGLRLLKIPKKYGGQEADCLTEVLVLEEICTGDIGFGMNIQHCWREGQIIAVYTTDEQRERFLPAFLEDPTFVTSFAVTEPQSGSDNDLPMDDSPEWGPRTTAVLQDGEWVINGRKMWITNGATSRLIILWARTDTAVPWTQGLSGFLVPRDAPGLSTGTILDKAGIRLNNNAELVFENCRVPESNLLGEVNRGMDFRHRTASGSKAKEGAKSLGVARAALEETVAWTQQTVRGGKPLYEHQGITQLLADMAMEIQAARLLMWQAAWAVDHDRDNQRMLNEYIKVLSGEVSVRAVTRAMEIWGAHGPLLANPIEKLFRDAVSMLHAGAGNQVVRHKIGLHLGEQPARPVEL
ncbi:MAG: acyl-CoA/acyl-ACP dehydrogenase [Chloroflexi bacterium]|nr:acyl-CoA/acyl-ACP dehydrogenase [Chloroflexota bacterium]